MPKARKRTMLKISQNKYAGWYASFCIEVDSSFYRHATYMYFGKRGWQKSMIDDIDILIH